jgi:hypothetical protein
MRQFGMVCRASYIEGKVLFVRTSDFGGPRYEGSGTALGVGHVSCIFTRSVLLSIRIVFSIALVGLQELAGVLQQRDSANEQNSCFARHGRRIHSRICEGFRL